MSAINLAPKERKKKQGKPSFLRQEKGLVYDFNKPGKGEITRSDYIDHTFFF